MSGVSFIEKKVSTKKPRKKYYREEGGDETRLGYVQYVQGIQPNVPACTSFIDVYGQSYGLFWSIYDSSMNVVCACTLA